MTTDVKKTRGGGRRSIIRRLKRDESGVTAIEFAFVAIPFLAFLFMTIEVAFVYGGTVSLEHALEKSARKIRVGQAFDSLEDFREDVCGNVVLMSGCMNKLVVDVRTLDNLSDAGNEDVFSDYQDGDGNFEQPDDDDEGNYNPGGGTSVVLINAFYKWDVIAQIPVFYNFKQGGGAISPLANQGDGSRIMSATVAFRNEPF